MLVDKLSHHQWIRKTPLKQEIKSWVKTTKTLSHEVQLIQQKEGMPLKETWANWSCGPTWTYWDSIRPPARCCKVLHLSRGNPWYMHSLGELTESSPAKKRPGGPGGLKLWHELIVRLQPRKPMVSWAASKEGWLAGRGGGLTTSTLPLWGLCGVLHLDLLPPAKEKVGTAKVGPKKAGKMIRGQRKFKGDLVVAFST